MLSLRGYSHPSPSLHPSSPLSSSFKSSLPLPKVLRQNRSFANLTKFLGIAAGDEYRDGDQSPEGEDDDTGEIEEDAPDAIDEESLMWDAQTALIAHQPALAIKYYSLAALPPHRSAPACLALGNLLARGSSLLQSDPASAYHLSREARSSDQSDKTITASNGKGAAARIREIFFSSPPTTPPITSPPEPVQKPIAVGWGIPRVGNKAVRDVEGMGLASAWLVLGLGWIVDTEKTSRASLDVEAEAENQPDEPMFQQDDDDAIVLPSKKLSRATSAAPTVQSLSWRDSGQDGNHSPDLSHTSSDQTDSTVLKTPHAEDGPRSPGSEPKERSESEQLKLLYDLLSPLVELYRHGQIQAHDPVSLPPITYAQLPLCLQPQGDLEKRRNAWQLGAVVATALLSLPILHSGSLGKGKSNESRKMEKRRVGVAIMANYLLGMTRPEPEMFFSQVVQLGQCGLEIADEFVKQAAKRLDIIVRSTPSTLSPASPKSEYPFPQMPSLASVADSKGTPPHQRAGKTHNRMSSVASTKSYMSTVSFKVLPSMKSTASLASMTLDLDGLPAPRVRPGLPPTRSNQSLAMDSLRRIRATTTPPAKVVNETWWPSLSTWTLKSPSTSQGASSSPALNEETTPLLRPTEAAVPRPHADHPQPATLKHKTSQSLIHPSSRSQAQKPCIRAIASSPNFAANAPHTMPSGLSTPRRRLPCEQSETDSINTTIDPELAAAELRSALTKQVVCGVCAAKGVNFPECRKCGLTFCSRTCRVDERKAGDGKRHVCGAWESRRFLTVPTVVPRSRRKSVHRPSPLSIKA